LRSTLGTAASRWRRPGIKLRQRDIGEPNVLMERRQFVKISNAGLLACVGTAAAIVVRSAPRAAVHKSLQLNWLR